LNVLSIYKEDMCTFIDDVVKSRAIIIIIIIINIIINIIIIIIIIIMIIIVIVMFVLQWHMQYFESSGVNRGLKRYKNQCKAIANHVFE